MTDVTAETRETRQCQECGSHVTKHAAFCSECGTTLTPGHRMHVQQPAPVGTPSTHNINFNVGSKQTNTLALTALILSVLIFFTGGITLLPAIICGHIARNATNRDPTLGGAGLALAALIISYATLIIGILLVLLIFVGLVGMTI